MESYICQNIKSLRKKNGMTQQDLANSLFVTHQAISKWERGESYPDISLIPELARLFDVPISFLWEEPVDLNKENYLNQLTNLSRDSISDLLIQGVLTELEKSKTIQDKFESFDFFTILNHEQKEQVMLAIIAIPDSEMIIEEFYFYLPANLKEKIVTELLKKEGFIALEALIPMMSKAIKSKVLENILSRNNSLFLGELLPFLDQHQKQIVVEAIMKQQVDILILDNYLPFFTKEQRKLLLEEN